MAELESSYDPQKNREKINEFWSEGDFFRVDNQSDKPPFTIVMPPPNVTGVLHMGHALQKTTQDLLIRWKRMSGFEALWLPGADHAGIATQTVVERHLIATQGKRRSDFSRDDFLGHVWEWKKEKEATIHAQFNALGCSCDWSRYRFTMDEESNTAVRHAFKRLFDEGLIYRGDYLVNWDPVTQTAIADDEVEYIDRQTYLWHIEYPLADGSASLSIATTRPETMLGDTAVAVHPEDERYQHLIGKKIALPLTNREIPIIADHTVARDFGTGAVKITPAHDPNDYQMGMRHDLPFLNIMTPDARINDEGAPFTGLTMEEARHAVVEALKKEGRLLKTEPHAHRVGISYRSKAVIEPYMSKQWFVKMDGFAKKLHTAATSGKFKVIPKSWEKTYFHWIDNLRDWCISRQLWWGHQIPIWYRKDDPDVMVCHAGEGLPPEVAADPAAWEQDPDVLDTWFSSGLWPLTTLGWPEQSADLKKFYPTSVLVTGNDILFFWVARMVLMGEYVTGELPFPETYLTGLIYGRSYWREDPDGGVTYISDEERKGYDRGEPIPKDIHSKWEKLSKSKGNVIDPLEIIEEYGIDAMRLALCASGPQNLQIDLDRRRFEEFKNFANKIWNGARFVFLNLDDDLPLSEGINHDLLQLEDKWILSVLSEKVAKVNEALGKYSFDHAAMTAYDFFWNEFCAYYVEAIKPVLFGKVGTPELRTNKQKILAVVLCQAVRLLHPIAPYITEELFKHLKEAFPNLTDSSDPLTQETIEALKAPACCVAPYPQPSTSDTQAIADFDAVQQIIYTVRNIRGEMKVPPGTATDVYLIGDDLKTIEENAHLIKALVRTKEIFFQKDDPNLPFSSTGAVGQLKVILPLPEELRHQEKQRLEKELSRLEQSLERIKGQLANKAYIDKAPPHLVEKTKESLSITEQELNALTHKLSLID